MGSAPKKIKKAIIDKPLGFIDKTVRGKPDEPTQSKEPAKSKVEPTKAAAKKNAQGGESLAEQRLLIEKNKKFKQTKV